MHGYMMPSNAPKDNPKAPFTWLHPAMKTGARMLAKPGNSWLCSLSSQKIGGELPAKISGNRPKISIEWLLMDVGG
jgi:hypothetical protein